MGPTPGLIVTEVWVKLSHENGVVTMVSKLNPSLSNVKWCKFYIHLRSLNVCHVLVEAMGLRIMASRSLPVA
jgi:hypothetical protein